VLYCQILQFPMNDIVTHKFIRHPHKETGKSSCSPLLTQINSLLYSFSKFSTIFHTLSTFRTLSRFSAYMLILSQLSAHFLKFHLLSQILCKLSYVMILINYWTYLLMFYCHWLIYFLVHFKCHFTLPLYLISKYLPKIKYSLTCLFFIKEGKMWTRISLINWPRREYCLQGWIWSKRKVFGKVFWKVYVNTGLCICQQLLYFAIRKMFPFLLKCYSFFKC